MLDEARAQAQKIDKTVANQKERDRTHCEIQSWLRDLGLALGYDVWIAANDRGRLHEGLPLGSRCLDSLPHAIATAQGSDAIRLIDVLWLEHSTALVAAAFEVEHSTSNYSGIVRMLDLALRRENLQTRKAHFLVAPDARETN